MEWTHELVLEFIELLQGEPVLWNTKHKNHKNRNLVSDAWIRVKNAISVPFSIEEMKKKKNSLLTQFREYKRKVNDSSKVNESYQPSWFAFDLMNSFLGELYDYKSPTDTCELKFENYSCESTTDNESHSFIDENTDRRMLRHSDSSNDSDSNTLRVRNRRRKMLDSSLTKQQIDGSYVFITERPAKKKNNREIDECDMYVQLLAQKLKKLDEEDRLSLMNDIDNLAFKYLIQAKSRNRPQSTSSSTHDKISTNN